MRPLRGDVPRAHARAHPLRVVRQRRDPDADYPWAPTREERERTAFDLERTWGENVDSSDHGAGRRRGAPRVVPPDGTGRRQPRRRAT